MLVDRLRLRDFRGYAAAEVRLGPGLTVVHGRNGAGKTNLLEALYFGCTGSSCRTSNEREVVRRISLLAQKNAPLRLAFAEGEVTVSAQTPDVGEARETVPVPFSGEAFEIGFNPDFLRDGLESLGGADVVLKLINPLRPGLIEAADGSGFLYLIMPIRLNV